MGCLCRRCARGTAWRLVPTWLRWCGCSCLSPSPSPSPLRSCWTGCWARRPSSSGAGAGSRGRGMKGRRAAGLDAGLPLHLALLGIRGGTQPCQQLQQPTACVPTLSGVQAGGAQGAGGAAWRDDQGGRQAQRPGGSAEPGRGAGAPACGGRSGRGGGAGPALGLLTGSGNRCARPVAVLRFALLGCARKAIPTNWRHAMCR